MVLSGEKFSELCCVVYHPEDENVDKDINGRHILCTLRIDIWKWSDRQ